MGEIGEQCSGVLCDRRMPLQHRGHVYRKVVGQQPSMILKPGLQPRGRRRDRECIKCGC